VRLQQTDEAYLALCLEVKIEVEEELDVLAGALAKARKLLVKFFLNPEGRVEFGAAGRTNKAGHVELRAGTLKQKNVVLERGEAAITHVLAELADVVEGADRGEAHLFRVVQTVGVAVRPIEAEAIADGPAEGARTEGATDDDAPEAGAAP